MKRVSWVLLFLFTAGVLYSQQAEIIGAGVGLINLVTGVTGTLPVANGGTNLTASADDNVMVGNGTTWQTKAVADCDDSGGNHLNYDTTTNAFSCGTSSSSAAGGADTQIQFNDGGTALGGDAGLTYIKASDRIVLTNTANAEYFGVKIDGTSTGDAAYRGLTITEGATNQMRLISVGSGFAGATGGPHAIQLWNFQNNGIVFGLNNLAQGVLSPDATGPFFTIGQTGGVYNAAFGALQWNTTQTPDTNLFLVGTTGRSVVIAEGGDASFDFAHAQQTTPTLFIHSANQNTTQWISFTHNGTNGIIDVGAGSVSVSDSLSTTGTLTSSRTTDIGWTPQAAANQACNTTCTTACVMGIDSGAPHTWLLCTDATADMCLCAGGS